MNALKKDKIVETFRYSWPFYIVVPAVLIWALTFFFGVRHRAPNYKTLTLFVSGEVKDNDKLEKDLKEKFADYDLKEFTCISSLVTDNNYNSKLSVPGYNTADVLIIPTSKLNNIEISAFGLELKDELIADYYPNYSLFSQKETNYGIKVDKAKVQEYMTLPDEDCYFILNAKSVNIGKYSSEEVVEHDMALQLVKDWGM